MDAEPDILIIDDDPAIRRTLRRILERAGHRVVDAADGSAGLRLVRKHGPMLVITDVLMPEVDGIETIQTLRTEFPHMKILAISGGGKAGRGSYLSDAELLGADRTMPKPFTPGELVDAVDGLLAAG